MKFRISTLGCKVNQYESQRMEDMLTAAGFEPAAPDELPDIYVINSCNVTSTADQKTRQQLHRARRENPAAVVVLCGCMSQAFPEKSAALEDVDIVIGNANRERLPELILRYIEDHMRVCEVVPHSAEYNERGCVTRLGDRARAYIKIEDGCNRFCSYCIIPYATGRVRSRSLESITAEARELAKSFREVVLVGINLSSYGQDCGLTLADAVDAAAKPDGIARVRLGSLEPDLMDDATLDRLAKQTKFCPQFHIAIQSGCDATLRRMNRHYTCAEFEDLVSRIRARFDNASITTDVMVGFAGETDEEFEQTMSFVRRIGFARAHCFVYSRREGTRAYDMPDQISPPVAAGRSARMIALCNESENAFLNSQTGREVEVLIERETADGQWEGYSENYTPVRIFAECRRGEIVRARIYAVEDGVCNAERTE